MAILSPDYGDGASQAVIREEQGKVVISRTEDVGPTLDAIKELRDNTPEVHKAAHLGGRYAASIPHIVMEQWLNEAGIEMWETDKVARLIKRKLNDPNYKKLRVWEGKI